MLCVACREIVRTAWWTAVSSRGGSFFFQAEDGIRDLTVTGVQTCALPISYPLRVIGRNSIAAYVMAHLFDDFVVKSFQTHFGRDLFKYWGTAYETLLSGRSEEHTSELQSQSNLVCRLLLEKKKSHTQHSRR